MVVNILLAFAISLGVAFLAYKKGALSRSGMGGALLVGTPILSFGGWIWFAVLATFFVSSSLLSRFGRKAKKELNKKIEKGGPRDWVQTLANGGVGAFLALMNAIAASPLWLGAFIGALATVNADTWATELGVLSKRKPRLITTGSKVPPGTSGGITRVGLLASFLASILIGAVAFIGLNLKAPFWEKHIWVPFTALICGMAGSLLDSYLGAARQAMHYCERCGEETEKKVHHCGSKTHKVRGKAWLNNDGVNFFSSLFGATIGALAAFLWA